MTDAALLPDGKVLLLNGAHKGSAGGYMADEPVSIPLIYDASASSGSRFTAQPAVHPAAVSFSSLSPVWRGHRRWFQPRRFLQSCRLPPEHLPQLLQQRPPVHLAPATGNHFQVTNRVSSRSFATCRREYSTWNNSHLCPDILCSYLWRQCDCCMLDQSGVSYPCRWNGAAERRVELQVMASNETSQ
ncbi:hypothetical protein BDZ45DRAFT_402045 [Acephala macrosclerotiorum]|nr:hypothetical protein BDZ45DRAFT_402045 [Acephala macrosclerotiorum]